MPGSKVVDLAWNAPYRLKYDCVKIINLIKNYFHETIYNNIITSSMHFLLKYNLFIKFKIILEKENLNLLNTGFGKVPTFSHHSKIQF